ncbi:MAG: T9SS type A sorting domain-containing protein [Chitinispirillaceae bacterium]|nr:T9SS type A sorting domain-containing protein [Chitinispirillaceae bacterium]
MNRLTLKRLWFLCILGFTFSVSAQSEEFNKIDAFTSATKYLRIDSILVYKTKAIVFWNEYWPDDDMEVLVYQLRWGTRGSPFQDSLNLKPYIEKVTNIDTIEPIVENTEYNGQFNRDYNRKQINVDFRFNTPPLPNKTINNRPVVFPSGKISRVKIFTIEGKLIATGNVKGGKVTQTLLRSILRNPGLYIVNLNGKNGRVLRAEKILIGR